VDNLQVAHSWQGQGFGNVGTRRQARFVRIDNDFEWLLPSGVPVIGVPLQHEFGGGDKRARSYTELREAGLLAPVADPWRYFDRPRAAGERRIAEWLRM
jgi:hypothetical protein